MPLRKQLSVIVGLLLLFSLVGCQPAAPNPDQGAPEPAPAKTFPRLSQESTIALPSGELRWLSPDDISADGNYLALTTTDGQQESLWLCSLGTKESKVVYGIPASEVVAGRLLLVTVGWTEDNKLIFVRQGTQPDGTHGGERGLLLLTADPQSGTTQELCWVPNPQSYIKQVLLNQESDYVLVHVGNTLWQVPLSGTAKKVVRTDLPSYDGLFFLRPSPDKTQFVYQFFEPEKRGIYLLDVSSGTETCLAKAGETFSFSPQWSPDGQHIAFYTANAKGDGLSLGEQYDIIEGEDAPAPIAPSIEVVTTAGQKIARLTIPDMKAAMFTWSSDSKHLAFLGTKTTATAAQEYPGPIFDWQSVYVADLAGNITKIADIPEETLGVVILRVLKDAAYYLTYRENETTLWLAQAGQELKKLELPTNIPVSESGALVPLYPQPALADSLFLSYMTQDKSYYLQVWQDQLELLAEANLDSSLVATPDGKLVLTSPEQDTQGGKLVIFAPERIK